MGSAGTAPRIRFSSVSSLCLPSVHCHRLKQQIWRETALQQQNTI